jgi:hypothetical protein
MGAEHATRPAGLRCWLVVALVLAGLSGCSASGATSTATATTAGQQEVAAIWRELIQCMRQNGMPNLPDPVIDSEGQPHFPGGDPGDPPPQAERACRHIYERFPASVRDGGNDQERPPTDIPALLRFADCMRTHGFADFPDPNPDGTFPIAGTSIGRVAKSSPRLRAADEACRRLNPDPEGRIHGS